MDSDPCSVHLIGLPVRWSPTFCLNNAIVSRQATWRRPLTADPPQCWSYFGTRRLSACLLRSRKKVWWNRIMHYLSHQTCRYTYTPANHVTIKSTYCNLYQNNELYRCVKYRKLLSPACRTGHVQCLIPYGTGNVFVYADACWIIWVT